MFAAVGALSPRLPLRAGLLPRVSSAAAAACPPRPGHRIGAGLSAPLPRIAASAMGKDWEGMWSSGLEPGQAFDATVSAPALIDLLEGGSLDVKEKTALVPGCGRGYDLALLVKHGAARATGLEISETAVKAATAWLAAEGGLGGSLEKASVDLADFFAYPGPPVDVVYDYTFFCAIDPAMRGAWGAKMSELVKPGGTLVTLMFPCIDKPVGPPFGVSREAYQEVLAAEFDEVSNTPPAASHPGREGQELIGVWRKK